MAYRIMAILMTLNDLQGHLSTSSLFKCDLSYSCDFNRHSLLCGSSAVVEFLVQIIVVIFKCSNITHCIK